MIRLGLRLTLRGGREAGVRLAVTAAAMALGVSLLLITLAGINALNAQDARAAWLSTSASHARPGSSQAAPDSLWWLFSADRFASQVISRVDVAGTGSRSPVPPGIPRLPGPGQFYASPALTELLRSTQASQLGDRFGGRQIGIIGSAALPAPNSLIIIIGHTSRQLSRAPGAAPVRSIGTAPGGGPGPYSPVQTLVVGTNGSSAAIERARTALELGFPYLGPPATLVSSQNSYTELQHVTDVVILVIAGCSLAVSAAGGLTDRRRPFSLLRLTGVHLGVLRRVVALETAAPLLVIAAVSAGAGLLASELFLKSELGESLRAPGVGYYLVVFAGIVVSLSVIASTLPLLKRVTGPEAARND